MVIKKLLIPIAFSIALLSIALVWAGGFTASVSPAQVTAGTTTQLFNFTIGNTGSLGKNIVTVNITLPTGFLFISGTNQTTATETIFSNTSTVLIWSNTTTGGFLSFNANATFVFNASVPVAVGNKNFVIGTKHNDSTSNTSTSVVTLIDATPAITAVIPASNSSYKANFTVNITITDTNGINISKGVYYRVENDTYTGSWTLLTNESASTTANSFSAIFDITSIPDWNYTFRFNVTDIFDQTNATVICNNVIIDDSYPSIDLFTLSASSVDVNGALTGTCTASDNSQSFGGGVFAPAITGIDTSTTGTKTATCTVNDTAGNADHRTATYTVSLASSGGSSGGGSGGGSGEGTTNSVIVSVVSPGKVEEITGFDTETGVTAVDLEVTNTVTGVSIAVQKLAEKPAAIDTAPSGAAIYTYLRITVPALNSNNLKTAKIEFAVPKSWLAENDIDKNTVALNRYGITWDKLTTSLVSEDESNVNYEAETPSFSIFAITGDKPAAPVEKTKTTEAKTMTKQVTTGITSVASAPKISSTAGIVALLIIIGLCLYWYKYKSGGKKKHRKH